MIIREACIIGLGLHLAIALAASAQPPSQRFGSGFDPNWFFDTMDRNHDGVVTRDEILDRRTLERFEDYLRRARVRDGRLTREAFLAAYEERLRDRLRTNFGTAETVLRNLDRNNDGKLDAAEIDRTQRLRAELDRWDSNRDGVIDLEELRPFIEHLSRERFIGLAPQPGLVSGEPTEPAGTAKASNTLSQSGSERPLIVFRAGKLPASGLPDWFVEHDQDGDGQVGLYEWAGLPREVFQAGDRNGDGFITIEEALRYEAARSPGRNAPRVADAPPVEIRGRGK